MKSDVLTYIHMSPADTHRIVLDTVRNNACHDMFGEIVVTLDRTCATTLLYAKGGTLRNRQTYSPMSLAEVLSCISKISGAELWQVEIIFKEILEDLYGGQYLGLFGKGFGVDGLVLVGDSFDITLVKSAAAIKQTADQNKE